MHRSTGFKGFWSMPGERNEERVPSAALLVIGDEILSGRTKDRNIGMVADRLNAAGVDLEEVRIVADVEAAIVEAVRALSERYDVVLTTGGIGPTHDDITADAVAKAFGVPIGISDEARAILMAYWAERGIEPNEARLRMARIPHGARLVRNAVSAAPGFVLGNVHVMAGVPRIAEAMMDEIVAMLPASPAMLSETIEAHRGEGDIAEAAARVQSEHPRVRIGSYPYQDGGRFVTRLVLRSRDAEALAAARAAMDRALESL
jgi:molybdenum cofactor synthesis domain-containing protein